MTRTVRLGWRCVSVTVIIAAHCAASLAQISTVGVNFIGGNDNEEVDASELVPADVAGLIPQANWNNVAPWSNNRSKGNGTLPDEVGTERDLIDSFGNVTAIDIAWDAENTFATDNNVIDNADERLTHGYLDNSSARPNIVIDITEIPYSNYDLVVYVGSDGNNRTGAVLINEDTATQRWYRTSTGSGLFTGPGSYIEADAIFEPQATPSNYVLFQGLSDPSVKIENVRGSANSGIHGLQIIQTVAPAILSVDVGTGEATLRGGDVLSIDINGIEISSDSGGLLPGSYVSVGSSGLDAVDGGFDADEIAGSSTGENWELIIASEETIAEGFLLGSTTLNDTTEFSLGTILDLASANASDSLSFRYSLANGQTRDGVIELVTSNPDFDGDGSINGSDFLTWQRGFPAASGATLSDGDANGDGQVDESDLAAWQIRYGEQAAASSLAAVPEPSSLLLLAAMTAVGCLPRKFAQ